MLTGHRWFSLPLSGYGESVDAGSVLKRTREEAAMLR